jgi:hypothetical protein
VAQHAGLTRERWAQFSLDQQILMVGNEMHRAAKLMKPEDRERLRYAYERVLYLCDLTIALHSRRGLRRELLRWRDLIAQLYIDHEPDAMQHRQALEVLLRFTPQAATQIPHVLGRVS